MPHFPRVPQEGREKGTNEENSLTVVFKKVEKTVHLPHIANLISAMKTPVVVRSLHVKPDRAWIVLRWVTNANGQS